MHLHAHQLCKCIKKCDINAIVHVHVKATHMNEYMCKQYKYISIYVIKAYVYNADETFAQINKYVLQ